MRTSGYFFVFCYFFLLFPVSQQLCATGDTRDGNHVEKNEAWHTYFYKKIELKDSGEQKILVHQCPLDDDEGRIQISYEVYPKQEVLINDEGQELFTVIYLCGKCWKQLCIKDIYLSDTRQKRKEDVQCDLIVNHIVKHSADDIKQMRKVSYLLSSY